MNLIMEQEFCEHLNKLSTMKLMEGTTNEDFSKRIKELVTRLSSVGDAVPDRRVVQITLGAPLKSYDPFVQAVLCQDELPHFNKLHGKLLLEDARREEEPPHHQALSTTRARRHFGTFYKGPVLNRGPSKTKLARVPMLNISKFKAPKCR